VALGGLTPIPKAIHTNIL